MGLLENEFLVYLNRFEKCCFEVEIGMKIHKIGEGTPLFKLKVKDMPDLDTMLVSTSLALGECYAMGHIDTDDELYDVLKCFLSERDKFILDKNKLKHIFKRSRSTKGQMREIKKYFDLGTEFFELILDESMSCSSAYFLSEEETLFEAQKNKVNYCLDRLQLEEGMSICEIGCGRSNILIEAAKKYNTHGLFVTMSKAQKQDMEELVKKEGLTELVEVVCMSYKDIPKLNRIFDRIVVVTMMENIGKEQLSSFFSSLNAVLKDNGMFLMHSLDMPYERDSDAWIKKYVMPATDIPYLPNILSCAMENGFSLQDVQNIRSHYAKTYRCWYENFKHYDYRIEEIFDRDFMRTWKLYLASYSAALSIGMLEAHQMVFFNSCVCRENI